jgi:hypothetical protein
MLDEYGFETYEENEFPLAYLITIRTHGTWLHGDERHSVDRHGRNLYGTPDMPPNRTLKERMKGELKQPPLVLNESQRKAVDLAIREFCEQRKYYLQAINVRTNHAHAVVSAKPNPKESLTPSKHLPQRSCGKRTFVGRMFESGHEAGVGVTCGSPVTLPKRLIMSSLGKAMCLSSQKTSNYAVEVQKPARSKGEGRFFESEIGRTYFVRASAMARPPLSRKLHDVEVQKPARSKGEGRFFESEIRRTYFVRASAMARPPLSRKLHEVGRTGTGRTGTGVRLAICAILAEADVFSSFHNLFRVNHRV